MNHNDLSINIENINIGRPISDSVSRYTYHLLTNQFWSSFKQAWFQFRAFIGNPFYFAWAYLFSKSREKVFLCRTLRLRCRYFFVCKISFHAGFVFRIALKDVTISLKVFLQTFPNIKKSVIISKKRKQKKILVNINVFFTCRNWPSTRTNKLLFANLS